MIWRPPARKREPTPRPAIRPGLEFRMDHAATPPTLVTKDIRKAKSGLSLGAGPCCAGELQMRIGGRFRKVKYFNLKKYLVST